MYVPTLPNSRVADDTVSCILTALVIEHGLTRERLIVETRAHLQEQRGVLDRPLRKRDLLNQIVHQHSNYDALGVLMRRVDAGRATRWVRRALRKQVAARCAHLLAPVEHQGATQ